MNDVINGKRTQRLRIRKHKHSKYFRHFIKKNGIVCHTSFYSRQIPLNFCLCMSNFYLRILSQIALKILCLRIRKRYVHICVYEFANVNEFVNSLPKICVYEFVNVYEIVGYPGLTWILYCFCEKNVLSER